MPRRLLLSRSPGETRAALVSDGRLVDYEVRRDHQPTRLGGLYLGRLRKVTGDGRFAFADIGDGEVLADLDARSADRAGWTLAAGALVPVQITQDTRRNRLARAKTRLSFAGPRLVYLPHGGADGVSHRVADPAAKRAIARTLSGLARPTGAFIARHRAEGAADAILASEAAALIAEWKTCAARARGIKAPGMLVPGPEAGLGLLRDAIDPTTDEIDCDDRSIGEPLATFCRAYFPGAPPPAIVRISAMADAFGDLQEQVEDALSRRVELSQGGSFTIERTEGMTAIDIDTGAAFDGASPGRAAQELNRRAAGEIATQLRVRALGGLVAVDLIGSPRGRAGAGVLSAFLEAFRDDPARAEVDLVDSRGVILISRQWSRQPLEEIVAEVVERGEGPAPESLDSIILRAAHAARVAADRTPTTRLAVHLAETAAAHWHGPRLALAVAELRAAVGIDVAVEGHGDWPAARVEIQPG